MPGRFCVTLPAGAETHGYAIHIVYLELPDTAAFVARVTARIAAGGRDVERERIATRLYESLQDFWTLYRPRSTTSRLYDGSDPHRRLIACGTGPEPR